MSRSSTVGNFDKLFGHFYGPVWDLHTKWVFWGRCGSQLILSLYVLWAPWMLFPGESSTQTLFLRVMENFLILILILIRALATQLPDIASMGSLTVNIQANNFTPQHTDNSQIHALAVNTDAQLGHLRNEIQETFPKGNATITERFALIGGWCQETYKCQMRVGTQF